MSLASGCDRLRLIGELERRSAATGAAVAVAGRRGAGHGDGGKRKRATVGERGRIGAHSERPGSIGVRAGDFPRYGGGDFGWDATEVGIGGDELEGLRRDYRVLDVGFLRADVDYLRRARPGLGQRGYREEEEYARTPAPGRWTCESAGPKAESLPHNASQARWR